MSTVLHNLREIVTRHSPDGEATPIDRVTFRSGTTDLDAFSVILDPMLCFVIQGAKRVVIGDRVMSYGSGNVLALSLHIPATGCLIEGTDTLPYLAIAIDLDRDMVADLLLALPETQPEEIEGFSVTPFDEAMLDPLLRLARLADASSDSAILGPLAIQEILYRAVRGPMGPLLRDFARGDGRTAQVRRAIDWILTNVGASMSVDQLAGIAGMSSTSFHRHFKALTALSPLNFVKQVRLHKARDMLRTANGGIAQIAFAVGYHSASQFSREYARAFGNAPTHELGSVTSDS